MRVHTAGPVSLYTFDLFAPQAGLVACCSGRTGGVSAAPYDDLNLSFRVGDDPEAVRENRCRLAAALGAELDALVVAGLIHENGVERVGHRERGRGAFSSEDAIADTDALITDDPGVVLAITLADCVPVFLYDPTVPAVGLAHAGWQGTLGHIASKTARAMQAAFGSDPADLLAAIGPSIGPDSYEVGHEVAERFHAEYPANNLTRPTADPGKFILDLWAANVSDLTAVGVAPASIEVARIDTYRKSNLFFSDRRQRPTGRFMALAMLR